MTDIAGILASYRSGQIDEAAMVDICQAWPEVEDALKASSITATQPVELPEGVFERGNALMYVCRGCDNSRPLEVDLSEYDPDVAYCGGSPRCLP